MRDPSLGRSIPFDREHDNVMTDILVDRDTTTVGRPYGPLSRHRAHTTEDLPLYIEKPNIALLPRPDAYRSATSIRGKAHPEELRENLGGRGTSVPVEVDELEPIF